jgi:ribosomal protein L34E
MRSLRCRRFGKLLVLRLKEFNKWHQSKWVVKCDCGKKFIVLGYRLRNGAVEHCAACGKRHHGFSKKHPREFHSWVAMIQRCMNPENDSYQHYGARGITVCERWSCHAGFINFLNDMGRRPKGKTLDRENVEGPYCPDNCRWASAQTQTENRRCSYTEEELIGLRKQAEQSAREMAMNVGGDSAMQDEAALGSGF